MKRKRVTKHVSLLLVVTLVLQMFVVPGLFGGNMIAEAASDPNAVVFEENFSYQPTTDLLATDLWDLETDRRIGTAPTFEDGVMKMSQDNSVQFNWTKVDGVGTYDSTKTYVFECDIQVTNWYFRTLYVAPGGWYNQIVLPNGENSSQVYVGATTNSDYSISQLKEKLHIKMEWK